MTESVTGAGNNPAQINLTGNLKNLKTKTAQTTDDATKQKVNSVFVESVKVYATDDSNQNGKVNGQEVSAGTNASIFNNESITGENVKNKAFANLSETGKGIANTKSQNTLQDVKQQFAKLFDKFNVKVGGEKLKVETAPGVTQEQVNTQITALDNTVKTSATSYAKDVNTKILQAYNEALQQIAQEAEAEAAQKALDDAINQDLNPEAANEAGDDKPADETVDGKPADKAGNGNAADETVDGEPAGKVGGNNPADKVGGNNPADKVGGNNPADKVGGNNPAGGTTYTIKEGDNLSTIAKDQKVGIKELYDMNKGGDAFIKAKAPGTTLGITYKKGEADPNKIKAGASLKLR